MSKELSIFNDASSFEHAQRIAKMLSSSELVPDRYKETGNGKGIANTLIAVDMAKRVGLSPMAVMQGLDIIKGKPGWSSQYVIGCIQGSGLFTAFDFVVEGNGMEMSCYATAVNKEGKKVIGATVTMEMAKAEGWLDKPGSKWKTMPELMIRYRAASFFGKQHVPHLLYGLQTSEELQDIIAPVAPAVKTLPADIVEKMIAQVKAKPTTEEISKLADALTAGNVDPQQTMDILSRAQEIVDSQPIDPPAAEDPSVQVDGSENQAAFKLNFPSEEGGEQ